MVVFSRFISFLLMLICSILCSVQRAAEMSGDADDGSCDSGSRGGDNSGENLWIVKLAQGSRSSDACVTDDAGTVLAYR